MRTNVLYVDGYDIRYIVNEAKKKFPGIESSADYERLSDLYMDYTMSCDDQEQKNWMIHYIKVGLSKLDEASRMVQPEQFNSRSGLEYEAYLDIIVAYNLLG